MSVKKANFMDKHPVKTSMSMKKANFMDEHHVQTSTSMKKAPNRPKFGRRPICQEGMVRG